MPKSGSRNSRAGEGRRRPSRERGRRGLPGRKARPGEVPDGARTGSAAQRRLLPLALPLLSGILLATSYPPFPPWGLAFCLVPLWLFWLREESWSRIFLGGWIAQFAFSLIGFHWVAHTAHEFGHLPWPVSALVLLLFCSLGHLFLPLAGVFWSILCAGGNLSRRARLLMLPAVTALCWYYSPMIFPWNLGYAWMWGRLPAFQLAEYVGFQGLNALTVFLNLALLCAWENRASRKGWGVLFASLAVFAAANAVGWLRERSLPSPDARARILIVQGNIGNLAKEWAERGEGFRDEILARYLVLTGRGLSESEDGRPDFAVWPESAFPGTIRRDGMDGENVFALREFLRRRGIALATGGRGFDAATGKTTNSFFVFDGTGKLASPPYDKTMLLAFGEYVPGAGLFPGLQEWLPHTGDFARGDGPRVMTLRGLSLGPQICYEGLFPWFSRGLADRGAEMFINVTNDSWFGTLSEPYQHMIMTLARGIEFRRPVVRSTNTGISTAMLADGTILSRSPLHREWVRTFEVPYRKDPPPTFFQSYGFRLVPATLWLFPAALLLAPRRGREKGK